MNYRFRMHDARLGRFFAVDPLHQTYPHNSPYAFSENEVIAFIELEGLEKYSIHTRSFISANKAGTDPLGNDFRGDGRGASLDDSGPNLSGSTSRANVVVGWDSPDKTPQLLLVDADLTVRYSTSMFGFATKKPAVSANAGELVTPTGGGNTGETGIPATFKRIPGSFSINYHAKDPITPHAMTPSLDVSLSGTITAGDGFINIKGRGRGDGFPSTEAFIEDSKGTRVFLGAHKEDGSIFTLMGGASELIFQFDLNIETNEKGVFTGNVSYSKLTYNPNFTSFFGKEPMFIMKKITEKISDYNKKVENDF